MKVKVNPYNSTSPVCINMQAITEVKKWTDTATYVVVGSTTYASPLPLDVVAQTLEALHAFEAAEAAPERMISFPGTGPSADRPMGMILDLTYSGGPILIQTVLDIGKGQIQTRKINLEQVPMSPPEPVGSLSRPGAPTLG